VSLGAFSSCHDGQEMPSYAALPLLLPIIDLEFADGVANVNKVSVGNGQKLLRSTVNEEKLQAL
jgi:hypothetical protein